MEITHLNKNVLFRAFAKACSNFDGGIVGGGNCFADDIGIGCPFEGDNEEMPCSSIKPAHWREVFEGKDKPEPEFHFGDKVTHYIDFPVKVVFSAYKDSRHSGEAYVLFDGDPECQVVLVKNLKAGWE